MENSTCKTRVYSPDQIKISAFLGGPFAMVYVLKKNFDALGDIKGSKMTIVWGSIFNILIFASLPFLPEKFPHYVLPVAYSLAAGHVAEKYQMSRKAILDSQEYVLQSNWNVFGVSVGLLIACVVVFGLGLLGLIALGLF